MGDDSIEMRPITDHDLGEVLDVYRQSEDFLSLGPEPKATIAMVLKDLEESRNNKGVFSGIYASDGKLVGVVDYVPCGYDGATHVAFISLLMIAAPFRNHGIGTRAIKLVEDKIKMMGEASQIQTAVQLNNPAALRFWQRNYYRVYGNPERRGDRTVVSYLQKSLIIPE